MKCAKPIQHHVGFLNATLDDRPLLKLDEYRIQSPPFNFSLPENNILNLMKGETTTAISDGNWVFLKPLTIGYTPSPSKAVFQTVLKSMMTLLI